MIAGSRLVFKKIIFTLLLMFPLVANAATLIHDTETEKLLRELVLPLSRAAEIPDKHMRIYIINDTDFNAFVRAGQDIYVNTGLLTQIKTPSADIRFDIWDICPPKTCPNSCAITA